MLRTRSRRTRATERRKADPAQGTLPEAAGRSGAMLRTTGRAAAGLTRPARFGLRRCRALRLSREGIEGRGLGVLNSGSEGRPGEAT